MRSYPRPQLNDTQYFDAILRAKHDTPPERRKTHLSNSRTAVLAQYQAYTTYAPRLEAMPQQTFNVQQAEVLRHCYDTSTFLDRIKDDLAAHLDVSMPQHMRDLCPYCRSGELYEWDHYLPRESYPEFSFFSPNLVEVCHACNHKKLALTAHPNRYFFHPYFDPGIEEEYVQAELHVDGTGIWTFAYRLVFSTSFPQSLRVLLNHHFQQLELRERYSTLAVQVMNQVTTRVRNPRVRLPVHEWQDMLREEAREHQDDYGFGDHRAPALLAMANHPTYLDQLLTRLNRHPLAPLGPAQP